MKKIIELVAIILAVGMIVLIVEGVPLRSRPDLEKIEKVQVMHIDYPDEVKEYSDPKNIKHAEALPGCLKYSLFKKAKDGKPIVTIKYIMKDGSECTISANEETVWWGGKTYAIQEEGLFVDLSTSVFFE